MSLSIPTSIRLRLSGINPLGINIGSLPRIQVALERLEIAPIQLGLAIKELPSIRLHLPAHFDLSLRICGKELFCLRLCGEAQAITEPYVPTKHERCDEHEHKEMK